MNRLTWKEIRRGFVDLGVPGAPREAATFWTEFRGRARLHPQQVEAPVRAAPRHAGRWVLAGACATLLAAWVGLQVGGGAHAADLSTVRSLEVVASHGGVLIMDDESTQSTLVWIVDLDPNAVPGDSA